MVALAEAALGHCPGDVPSLDRGSWLGCPDRKLLRGRFREDAGLCLGSTARHPIHLGSRAATYAAKCLHPQWRPERAMNWFTQYIRPLRKDLPPGGRNHIRKSPTCTLCGITLHAWMKNQALIMEVGSRERAYPDCKTCQRLKTRLPAFATVSVHDYHTALATG
jgi:hypothetical protein